MLDESGIPKERALPANPFPRLAVLAVEPGSPFLEIILAAFGVPPSFMQRQSYHMYLGAILLIGNAWANRLLAKRVMSELRKDVQLTLDSPYVSDDDKAELRARFASMEMAAIKARLERGKLLLDVQFGDLATTQAVDNSGRKVRSSKTEA
jgi:hypothetical protein